MIKTADYHIHTKLCQHAKGEMEEYVKQAVKKKFIEIGFADHAPADLGFDPDHRMTYSMFPKYVEKVHTLRNKFVNINIRLGIESDIYPGFESLLEKLLREFTIDYVVGSVHYIDKLPVFLRELPKFSKAEKKRFIHCYFSLIEKGVRSGLIDIVGHLDVIKWIFPDQKDEISDTGYKVLQLLAEKGTILELNTSGLRKLPGEIYPAKNILKSAFEFKIPICMGSDAHSPVEVGADFDKAHSLLKNVGYCAEGLSKNKLNIFLPDFINELPRNKSMSSQTN